MFRKKEYIILLVIAAALIAYLSLREKDQTHYRLPEVARLETGDITKVEITSSGGKKTLIREENQWRLEPQNYLADGGKVEEMLKIVGQLEITDLVSSSANYARYELDDEHKINISAWEKDSLVRTFDIGKVAPTFQHTYLRLAEDGNVYQARGHFRIKFDQSAEDLRDKKVLAFKAEEVQSIRMSLDGESLTLQKRDAASRPEAAAKTEEQPEEAKQEPLWHSDKAQAVDQNTVKFLLSDLADLECAKYLDDGKPEDFKSPGLQITLRGEKEYRLSVFKPLEGDTAQVPATSSMKEVPFFLSEWKAKSITEAAQKLMGKEPEPDKQATQEVGKTAAEPEETPKAQ